MPEAIARYGSMPAQHYQRRQAQSGVGLIEILVAVVLISIGFLAVGKMQIEGMRFSQSAYARSQAALLMQDMSDRMRSNEAGVANGLYDAVNTANPGYPAACIAANTPCTSADIANNDIYEWSASITGSAGGVDLAPLLPQAPGMLPSGSVVRNGDALVITVQWPESIEGTLEMQTLSLRVVAGGV